MSLTDHSLQEGTYSESLRGYVQRMATTHSQDGGTLSINYDEVSPPLITFLHKVWFEYRDAADPYDSTTWYHVKYIEEVPADKFELIKYLENLLKGLK